VCSSDLSQLLPGLAFSGPEALLLAGLAFGVVNTFLKPILFILTLPITFVTLGLAALDASQEAIHAAERVTEARSDILGASGVPPSAIKDLIYPLSGGDSRGSSSELGRTMMALVQTAIQLAALRSAEMEAATRGQIAQTNKRAPGAAATARTMQSRRGKVRIASP
jgi:hypothetical protein